MDAMKHNAQQTKKIFKDYPFDKSRSYWNKSITILSLLKNTMAYAFIKYTGITWSDDLKCHALFFFSVSGFWNTSTPCSTVPKQTADSSRFLLKKLPCGLENLSYLLRPLFPFLKQIQVISHMNWGWGWTGMPPGCLKKKVEVLLKKRGWRNLYSRKPCQLSWYIMLIQKAVLMQVNCGWALRKQSHRQQCTNQCICHPFHRSCNKIQAQGEEQNHWEY